MFGRSNCVIWREKKLRKFANLLAANGGLVPPLREVLEEVDRDE
ncbi:hypothetical protein M5a_00184 [Klebsiella phage VLCpiM5a]|nr:hypothetical protein M5a_00184 [Klebsiella phage VLCpiM5a]